MHINSAAAHDKHIEIHFDILFLYYIVFCVYRNTLQIVIEHKNWCRHVAHCAKTRILWQLLSDILLSRSFLLFVRFYLLFLAVNFDVCVSLSPSV